MEHSDLEALRASVRAAEAKVWDEDDVQVWDEDDVPSYFEWHTDLMRLAEEAERAREDAERKAAQLEAMKELDRITQKGLQVSRVQAAQRNSGYRERIRQRQRDDDQMIEERGALSAPNGRHIKG